MRKGSAKICCDAQKSVCARTQVGDIYQKNVRKQKIYS